MVIVAGLFGFIHGQINVGIEPHLCLQVFHIALQSKLLTLQPYNRIFLNPNLDLQCPYLQFQLCGIFVKSNVYDLGVLSFHFVTLTGIVFGIHSMNELVYV